MLTSLRRRMEYMRTNFLDRQYLAAFIKR
jgi:hypothetical protein